MQTLDFWNLDWYGNWGAGQVVAISLLDAARFCSHKSALNRKLIYVDKSGQTIPPWNSIGSANGSILKRYRQPCLPILLEIEASNSTNTSISAHLRGTSIVLRRYDPVRNVSCAVSLAVKVLWICFCLVETVCCCSLVIARSTVNC